MIDRATHGWKVRVLEACGWCGVEAQLACTTREVLKERVRAEGTKWEEDIHHLLEVWTCPRCAKLTVATCWESPGDDPSHTSRTILSPSVPDDDAIPPHVLPLVEEARRVKGSSPSSYATQVGRVIEEMRRLDPSPLDPTISGSTADRVARELTNLRHKNAHADHIQTEADDVPLIESLFEGMLDTAFRAPRRLDKLESVVAQKRAAARAALGRDG